MSLLPPSGEGLPSYGTRLNFILLSLAFFATPPQPSLSLSRTERNADMTETPLLKELLYEGVPNPSAISAPSFFAIAGIRVSVICLPSNARSKGIFREVTVSLPLSRRVSPSGGKLIVGPIVPLRAAGGGFIISNWFLGARLSP